MTSTTATMSQLNIRMNSAIKAAGDATLARAGVSATELIRAVWAKVSCGEEALAQLAQVLLQSPSAVVLPQTSDICPGDVLVQGIVQRQAAFEDAFDLDASTYVPLDEDEMAELLFDEQVERERERLVSHV